jgi:cholesterol transport system auxiliary component
LNSGIPGHTGAKALLVLAFMALLTGCGAFRGPPPVTYDLAAPESIPPFHAGTAAQIMIPEPKALKVLDSESIVVTSGPTISYYPDAQWPDRLPKVFQARAIEAFEQSKRARAVGRPGEGLSIDYQILIEIRSFAFVSFGSRGVARVEVFAKIVNDRNGRVAATRKLVGEAPVGRDDAKEVVAGLNAAMDQVLVELVNWTVSQV